MGAKESVLQLVISKGPVIPSQVNKEIDTSILIASATLSELVSDKKIEISNIKVGGSPLYYYPGQESKLQDYSDKLKGPEKEAYNSLFEKKILRDRSLLPAIRVALRQIKDFAKPLQVSVSGNPEIFWKWYLMSNEEAATSIKSTLTPEVPIQKTLQHKEKELQVPIPKTLQHKEKEPLVPVPVSKPTPKQDSVHTTSFLERIDKYFKENEIKTTEKNIIRKGSDAEFIIQVPSAVGLLNYFCKAKAKKKLTDGDLGSAFVQGQMKKLPVLFLTTGNLTKKAEAMLEAEFQGMGVRKV